MGLAGPMRGSEDPKGVWRTIGGWRTDGWVWRTQREFGGPKGDLEEQK